MRNKTCVQFRGLVQSILIENDLGDPIHQDAYPDILHPSDREGKTSVMKNGSSTEGSSMNSNATRSVDKDVPDARSSTDTSNR